MNARHKLTKDIEDAYAGAAGKRRREPAQPFPGLRKAPDKWPDEPPLSTTLSRGDLLYFMRAGLESRALSRFERQTAEQVLWAIEGGRKLSRHHARMLDEFGVLRACWDNDLDLWSEGYSR
jgi:hypothetical protein